MENQQRRGLWVPGSPGKGMMKAGEEEKGSKGWLWSLFWHLLEWREQIGGGIPGGLICSLVEEERL